MRTVLLHVCCCGCASTAIRRLQQEGFSVTGFFFNPNIHPRAEYEKRKNDLAVLRREYRIEIIEGEYDPRAWFACHKAYAAEREGGRRCRECYHYRLQQTCSRAEELGCDFFTTTLTISPHKKSSVIFDEGKSISEETFLPIDFKKKDGFKDAARFSREHDLYRQEYCGCVYSFLESRLRRETVRRPRLRR